MIVNFNVFLQDVPNHDVTMCVKYETKILEQLVAQAVQTTCSEDRALHVHRKGLFLTSWQVQ